MSYKYDEAVKSFHNGVDSVCAKPGQLQSAKCKVCGADMAVQRGAYAATSWVEFKSGGKHLHDRFYCERAMEPWHLRARSLRAYADGLPSQRLRAIVEEELQELLITQRIADMKTVLNEQDDNDSQEDQS